MADALAAVRAWREVLDRLDADLAALEAGAAGSVAESLAAAPVAGPPAGPLAVGPPAGPLAAWSPPELPGTLPEEFAPFARELIARQREVMRRLEDARARAAEELLSLRPAVARGATDAVYLDVQG